MPTDKGYRFFVDSLLDEFNAAGRRMFDAMDSLDAIRSTIDRLLEDISGHLSSWSNCLSFISLNEQDRSEIRRLELTPVSSHGMLIILVLSNGMIENKLVQMPADTRELPLDRFTEAINQRLSGLRICDVDSQMLDQLFGEIRLREEFLAATLRSFFKNILSSVSVKIFIDGHMRLISHPEFQDPEKLMPLLELVEASRDNPELLVHPPHGENPSATIGREHDLEPLFECSSIKRDFRFGDHTAGTVGLVGPRRMDYSGLFRLVDYISLSLGRMLENLPYFD